MNEALELCILRNLKPRKTLPPKQKFKARQGTTL